MVKQLFVILIFYFLGLTYTVCQTPKFYHITANNGLSQNSVISLTQDSFGFMWFATQDGLNKYNGSSFEQFEVFFRDITEKDYSQLGKVFCDQQNNIWITALDGQLGILNSTTNQFEFINSIQEASTIIQLQKDEYLVGSYTNGIYKLSLNEAQEWQATASSIPFSVYQIKKWKDKILLATDTGILELDEHTLKTQSLFPELANIGISTIESYADVDLIIGTFENGLYSSAKGERLTKYTFINKEINVQDLYVDTKGRLWVATYGDGLYMVSGKNIKHFENNPHNKHSINYNDILDIFEDNKGNLWFGTDGGGVSIIESDAKPIHSITNTFLPLGTPVDVPRAICLDHNQNLWIGTSGKGLTVVSQNLEYSRHFSSELKGENYIPNDRIMSLMKDEDDVIWMGTQGDGLFFFDPKINRFNSANENLPCKTIWNIKTMDDDHLWLSSRNEGLFLFNRKNQTWKQFKNEKDDTQSIPSNNIRVITNGNRPDLYFLGSDDGKLIQFNNNRKIFEEISLGDHEIGAVKSLYLDGSNLWVGTQQSGILILDILNGTIKELNKNNGLPNNVIYSLLPHNHNYVWISTNKGLCQINKQKVYHDSTFVVDQYFTLENGLVSNEFNTGAYHLDEFGKLYFGGIDGVNWFDPNMMAKNQTKSDASLLDLITTNRNGQKVYPIYDKKSITLNHKDRNFQIRYSVLDFSDTKRISYQYQLEGIQDEWVLNEKNELISFSNIPPGHYIFKLKATNKDGVWNTNSTTLNIDISAAFWQTLWFKILCGFFLLMLLYSIYYFRVSGLKKQSRLKEKITKAETVALRSQMNPHFLFNSLNAIDHYILKNDPLQASDYLSKFSKLVRRILDYSDVQRISLQNELDTLELYIKLEQLRFSNKFEYKFHIADNINRKLIFIPPLLLQPFVENAIWHGLLHKEEEGLLSVFCFKNEKSLIVEIEDNGIGRIKAQEVQTKSATKHKSFGMKITEERIRLINQLDGLGGSLNTIDKYNDEDEPTGTKIIIELPVQALKSAV